jgi:peptide/nickel transport system substrate-binding protein
MAAALVAALVIADRAVAQKSGGVLRTYNSTNPPSASIVEEVTVATAMAFSGIFNNVLIFDQSKPRDGLDTIMPELAESWSWDETRTRLTVKLRQGVRWHDGKPFTAKDVQCTWYRALAKNPDELRMNPRGTWWSNLKDVTLNGDFEATFVLGRAQASFPALLASNLSPVYPCHVPAKEMRRRPIGTGPFKLASFDSNRSIKLVKNADYWKPGLPYLDGIEMSIISNRSTRMLAFIAREFDLTFVADITVPLIADVKASAPEAICELAPTGVSTTLLVNNKRPPFDDVKLRQAMALALDRQGMIDILTLGKAKLSGVMMPPPEGQWGMPTEMAMALPFCLQLGPQLHQVLQSARREAPGGAVDRGRRRQAQADRVADREDPGGGRGPSDHLPQPRCDLLAPSRQGSRAAPELHLQQLAPRKRLAGQVGALALLPDSAEPAHRASGPNRRVRP